MPEAIKDKKITFTVWWVLWSISTLIVVWFTWWISLSSAEVRVNEKIEDNSVRILLIEKDNEWQEKKLQNHVNYSYTIKSDLKKEIDDFKKEYKEDNKTTQDKMDKMYDYIIKN